MTQRVSDLGIRGAGLVLAVMAASVSPAFAATQTSQCKPPISQLVPQGDAMQDARAPGALFKRLDVPGLSDVQSSTDSMVSADFNHDGLNDLLIVNGDDQKLRLLINQGCFSFAPADISIVDSEVRADSMGRALAVVNVADFNRDGFLDIFISRNATRAKQPPVGNVLLISQGDWHTFKDVAPQMGIKNETAYNRGSSFGDFDGDGYLDIAVAADMIGALPIGVAQQQLYRFKPGPAGFADGRFEDVGGTPLVPGFGGTFACNLDHKAGPMVSLSDLDNDGDLDLVQSYHQDLQRVKIGDACSPANLSYGILAWRNMLRETGKAGFKPVDIPGMTGLAHYILNAEKQDYDPVGSAISLPYMFFGDADNSGTLDVLGYGPADPGWRLGSTTVTAKFWSNDGGFKLKDTTSAQGLDPLGWPYAQWFKFWGVETSGKPSVMARVFCEASWQPTRCRGQNDTNSRFYGADAQFADFNNDGWLDLVVANRHESDTNLGVLRNVLFMNRGDGRFDVTTTQVSGIDVNSIALEATDLNNDGLIDLLLVADPNNSYIRVSPEIPELPKDRFASQMFVNSGALGGLANNWVRLEFSGVTDAELIGARVERIGAKGEKLGLRVVSSNHSYKSGGALAVHWGLGKAKMGRFVITLPSGKTRTVDVKRVNTVVTVNLASAR